MYDTLCIILLTTFLNGIMIFKTQLHVPVRPIVNLTSYHMTGQYAYHCYSYLFWSDSTGSNAQIGRSELSGKNRTALVTSAQGLVSPTTLVVDLSSQKLYWLDSGAEKIGHINVDGSQLFTQTISSLGQMSAMTIYRVRTF